jgi:hypothetical protein
VWYTRTMPYKDPAAQKAAKQAWYQRNKDLVSVRQKQRKNSIRKFVEEHKEQNSECADCGISYPPHMLDFDHLGDKEFGIAHAVHLNKSLEDLKKEIDKCEIVCANCHRHRTYMRSIKLNK